MQREPTSARMHARLPLHHIETVVCPWSHQHPALALVILAVQGWDVRGDEEEEDEGPIDLELQAAEMDAAVLRMAQLSARRRR